jgi:hypothetical protein
MLLWMAQLSDEDLIYVVATSPGHGLDALEYPGMPTPTQ